MNESRDRRSALHRLAAIVAASAGAVAGSRGDEATAEAEAGAERHGRKKRVGLAYSGSMSDVTYTPHHDGDDTHWIIRGRQDGDAEVRHLRSGSRDRMNGSRLDRLMRKKTGGRSMRGMPQLTIGDINWRILTADYDRRSDEWTLDVRVCDSNPDRRPIANAERVATAGSLDPVSGCSCSCNDKCYQCDNGQKRCARSYCAACQGCW